jgi:uncharacterized protein YggE
MDTMVTIRLRSLLLAAVVLLALVTAYLLGTRGGAVVAPVAAAPQQPAAPASASREVVRMTGSGEATAVPDRMRFSLTVTSKRLELDEALDASSGTMRRVLATLEPHGVEPRDVQTTGLQMQPEYDYHDYGPPTLTGYRVTQRASVQVDELRDGGAAITAAVETGGNDVRVGDIRLEVGDPGAVLAEAREAAVADARAKAEQYAAASGATLGEVVGIGEVRTSDGNRPRDVVHQLSSYRAEALDSVPVKAGREDLTVRVEVVWAFE